MISDMRDVKFDFNPFNISAVTAAIGIASVEDEDYFQARIAEIIETRDHAIAELRHMGFEVTDSHTMVTSLSLHLCIQSRSLIR